MSQTLTYHLNRIRDNLDESVAKFWTQPQLRRWVNDAATEIARRAEVLQATSDIATTAAIAEYALPATTLRVYRVEWKRTSDTQVFPLEYRNFNAMDSVWWTQQNITQNTPYYYTMWGFNPSITMRLFPVPAQAGSAKVFFYRLPTALADDGSQDSSTVEVPTGWDDLIEPYVEYVALRKDADPRWQEAKALFDERLDAMITLTRNYSDQAGIITPASGAGWIPSWLWGGDTYGGY